VGMSALDVGEVLGSAAPGLRRGDAPKPSQAARRASSGGSGPPWKVGYLEHAVEARIAGLKNGDPIVFALVLVFCRGIW
jgi:hypothetical protein